MQAMKANAITYVVDDDPAVRDGLCALLGTVSIPTRAYASANEFLQIAEPGMVGCLVVDVRMPGMSGLELLHILKARDIHLPVIVISGHGDVAMAVRAMKAGAVDFLLKPFNEQELLDQIFASLNLSDQNSSLKQTREQAAQRFSELTPRERQILDRIMQCQHSKAIAFDLGISEKTVDVHRFNIMRKTGTRNISQLIQLRIQAGDAGSMSDAGLRPGEI
jgi:FixJ family two-component response regulator